MLGPFNQLKECQHLMITEVRNNYNSPVIASEAKQSHPVNISRLLRLRQLADPRNDFLADLRA